MDFHLLATLFPSNVLQCIRLCILVWQTNTFVEFWTLLWIDWSWTNRKRPSNWETWGAECCLRQGILGEKVVSYSISLSLLTFSFLPDLLLSLPIFFKLKFDIYLFSSLFGEHTLEILLPDDRKITEISGMIYYKIGVELPLLSKIAPSSISIGKTPSSGKSYNTCQSTIDRTVYLAILPSSWLSNHFSVLSLAVSGASQVVK